MSDQILLVQVMPNNTIIPMVTSAEGEVSAAKAMDEYPSAGYHFTYALVELQGLSEDHESQIFEGIKEFW